MLRLYHLPLSPFCRKVRLVLAEKKVEVELIEERYWEQSTEFLKKSPSGRIKKRAYILNNKPIRGMIIIKKIQKVLFFDKV